MKPLDELSDDDIITLTLVDRIRQLDADLANERRAKAEVIARLETKIADARQLEDKCTVLAAENARLSCAAGKPAPFRPELLETDYFVGIP